MKIDKSFVDTLGTREGAGMVQSILRLGDSVQVATLAEGIETDAQLRELRELGCAYGQGYLFARPLHESDVGALLLAQTAAYAVPS